jgi:RHS repeat-associated protein
MVPLSDKTLKPGYGENKYRFNSGSEIQNKEFSDGGGLEWYETSLRTLDPQIGRWWQPDPKPNNMESPYAAMGNNPVMNMDPMGDSACCGGLPTLYQAVMMYMAWSTMRSVNMVGNRVILPVISNTGAILNGQINALTFGYTTTNPAQDVFGVQTEVNPWATRFGGVMMFPFGFEGGGGTGDNFAFAGSASSAASGLSLYTPYSLSAYLLAGKATADMAKEGADLAGITQNTKRIPAPSGKAQFRVPDFLNAKAIGEVKLVDKLHFSSQIKDFLAYAQTYKIPFTLYVRGGVNPTVLTPQLKQQVDDGLILLQRLIPTIIK